MGRFAKKEEELFFHYPIPEVLFYPFSRHHEFGTSCGWYLQRHSRTSVSKQPESANYYHQGDEYGTTHTRRGQNHPVQGGVGAVRETRLPNLQGA